MTENLIPIPEPPGLPIIGFTDIDRELPLRTLTNLAEKYGEIYKITTAGKVRVIVSSNALVNEICDETRFGKKVAGALQVRFLGKNS
jgi:cytochrome P450/NADPH-cytochrome P450 reductase